MTAERRPNFLVICADQLKANLLGCYGNDAISTPSIDALAAEGTVFTEATVANPTCMPNRSAMLTGRWPSVHGTRHNGIPLDPDANTFPRQLREAGYRTAAVGKMHLQNMGFWFSPEEEAEIRAVDPLTLDRDAKDAATRAWTADRDRFEDRARFATEDAPSPDDYYGFAEVDFVIGHGDTTTGNYRWWALERGVDPEAVGGAANAQVVSTKWDQVYQTEVPAEVHNTTYIGERAAERLRDLAESDEPFLLFASFPDPHHPFAAPRGYFDRYEPADIELPATFHNTHEGSPDHIRRAIENRGEPHASWAMLWSPDEDQYRDAAVAEYGLIELMDEAIGRILDTLEETGLAESTIVIFTADHGDFFGDHGLMLKHMSHYRAVTRVPLIVRLPEDRTPAVRDDLVATPDLAPTLIELAGARGYRGIQGRSIAPLIAGLGATGAITTASGRGVPAHRDAVLVEEDQPYGTPGLPAPVRMRTLVTREARLTRYVGTDFTELYELVSDPLELCNVAASPSHADLLHRMTARMADELAALDDTGIAPTASA